MKYVPALDGIRALAVLLVVAFHSQVPGFGAGFLGVDVFFVLSGYLITSLLLEEHGRTGRIELTRFYVRRLRRLYPALLAMLAVYLVIAPWAFPRASMMVHVRDAVLSAHYLADYARTFHIFPRVLLHMWSLSIEEHFYLVWPLLLLAALRLPRRLAIASLAGLFVAATAWRLAEIPHLGWGVYQRFDTHASGLVLGCLAGLIGRKLPTYCWPLGVAGMVFALVAFVHGQHETMTMGFTIAELSALIVILSQPAWLGAAPLAWIGRMSYGLYLWHYLIVRLIRLSYPWWVSMSVATIGGLALAALSYYTIERYFRAPPRLSLDARRPAIEPSSA